MDAHADGWSTLTPHQVEVARAYLARQAAQRHHVVIYLSGAHAYGFPSPDSDLDLKCVHLAPTAALVGLTPPVDDNDEIVVEHGVELDYGSNELGPVLRGCIKGNGNYLERLLGRAVLGGDERDVAAAAAALASREHPLVGGLLRDLVQDLGELDAAAQRRAREQAGPALAGLGLDVLLVTGTGDAVLAAPHNRAAVGERSATARTLAGQPAGYAMADVMLPGATTVEHVLVVQAAKAVRDDPFTVAVLAGRRIGDDLVEALRRPGRVDARVVGADAPPTRWSSLDGPVSRIRLLGQGGLMVTGADLYQRIFQDTEQVFSAEKGYDKQLGAFYPRGLLLMDFDEHRANRRLMQGAFKVAALQRYLEMMQPTIARHVQAWGRRPGFVFYPAIKQLLLAGQVVVGVGNIYASESLFRAGIRPTTAAARLSRRRCDRLADEIRATTTRLTCSCRRSPKTRTSCRRPSSGSKRSTAANRRCRHCCAGPC